MPDTHSLLLSDTPSVAGLTFRLFQGEADLAAIQAVRRAVQNEDGALSFPGPDSTATPRCDPAQDCLIAEVDSRMIGFTWLDWWTGTDLTHVYLHAGCLLPQWRRKGIGRTILHWQQQRLRQIAHSHPVTGLRFFAAHTAETQTGVHTLLLSEGYHVACHRVEMTYQLPTTLLPAPSLPDNLELRPFEREQLPALYEANDEAFQDFRLDYGRESYEEFLQDIHWPQTDTSLWFIAWEGGQIAGLALNLIDGTQGETPWVAVRHPWRKRGLARTLMTRTLRCFQEHGIKEAKIMTVMENSCGSFHLYKRLGYNVTLSLPRFWKEMILPDRV